jgi:hypothetical protein
LTKSGAKKYNKSKGSYNNMNTIKVTFMQVLKFRLSEFFRKSHKKQAAKTCTMESI